MTIRNIFHHIMLALGAFVLASCASDLDNAIVTIDNSNIRLVVGDFPAFGESSTRAVGTEDPGKTAWAVGEELLLEINSTTVGSKYATFTYNGTNWDLTGGELAYKEGEVPSFKVYYAPEYKWDSGRLVLKDDWTIEGMDEYIEGRARITSNGEAIDVSFSDATRNYSRLRIATIPDEKIFVEMQNFIPVTPGGSSSPFGGSAYTLHSDKNGNAYLYGKFVKNSIVSVKYGDVALAAYTFSGPTEDGKSYALDATVISLVGMTSEEIHVAVLKIADELSAGKTRFNIHLDAEPGKDVFGEILYGLNQADYSSIDLTLMGCKKIPASTFSDWRMLKSIVLPDVTEIGESAFAGCDYLRKVVFGTPLTRVYGNPENFDGGIFKGCNTYSIALVLSGKQMLMTGSQVENENKYVWTPGEQGYKNISDHQSRIFLGYVFNSVTCGDKTYPKYL